MGRKPRATGVPTTSFFPATHACKLAGSLYNTRMESITKPVCRKCESENVTHDFEHADPEVGIFTPWISFHCDDCDHSWGCHPTDVEEYHDEPDRDEPDFPESYY